MLPRSLSAALNISASKRRLLPFLFVSFCAIVLCPRLRSVFAAEVIIITSAAKTERKRGKSTMAQNDTNKKGSNLRFDAEMFKAADKLRGNMEPSDYKHVALGLIFLKYISDSFEARRQSLLADNPQDVEDRDAYLADNVFWVPKDARWSHLQAHAKQPTIGTLIDDAMRAIAKANATLQSVLPKDYARPALN